MSPHTITTLARPEPQSAVKGKASFNTHDLIRRIGRRVKFLTRNYLRYRGIRNVRAVRGVSDYRSND